MKQNKLFQRDYSLEKSDYTISPLALNVSLRFIFRMLSEHIHPSKLLPPNSSYLLSLYNYICIYEAKGSTCMQIDTRTHKHMNKQCSISYSAVAFDRRISSKYPFQQVSQLSYSSSDRVSVFPLCNSSFQNSARLASCDLITDFINSASSGPNLQSPSAGGTLAVGASLKHCQGWGAYMPDLA